jgi:5-methylthioadenosine/S-adenosylhomocysteine deaminase
MRLGMYSQRARYTAPGRYADFLVVDPTRPDTGPMWDPYATYVLACGLRNLDEVRVGGRLVSSRGETTNPLGATVAGELHSRVIASARRAGLTPPVSPLTGAAR